MGLLEDIRLCECDVYVQINRVCDPDKYIHLSKLDEALHDDHCMATISPKIRAQILQTLYIASVIMCPISMELAKSSSYKFSFNMQASLAMDMSNLVHWLEDITWL